MYMESPKARRERELAERGYALPEPVRLAYISQPSRSEPTRWVFHGSPEVVLGYQSAYELILLREAQVRARAAQIRHEEGSRPLQ